MKKFLILNFLATSVYAQFPVVHQIANLVQPVLLNSDTTIIYLQDFFVQPEKIDSVQMPKSGTFYWDKKLHLIHYIAGSDLQTLNEMKLWSDGVPYSIVLRKSQMQLVEFSFSTNADIKSVSLVGDMNGWNTKATPLQLKDGKWKASLMLNPGKYAYQLVVNDKWQLDPANSDSTSNGNGGFNSVKKVEGASSLPKAELLQATDSSIIISATFPRYPFSLAFYWQNFRLGKRYIKMIVSGEESRKGAPTESRMEIKIPAEARQFARSFMRVFTYDNECIGNDLLVPLQDGKVVTSTSQLTRQDKHSNAIYFVLVDRFCDGDSSNNFKVSHPEIKAKANYYGGDLAGITKQIRSKYFQQLGMNALWISPIVRNPDKAFKEFPEPHDWYSGYHGYWPISLTQIDYRFGDDKALHDLVQAAHNSNMNVLLDLVANHLHEDYPLIKQHPEWRTNLDLPDGRKNIRLWDECRLTTWFDSFLPTLDFSQPAVIKLQVDSSLYWLQKFDLDGFRHDATKHIPENFWRALTLAIKKNVELPKRKSIYQLGETYGSKELIGSYLGSGMMDGQFDFNLYFDAREVFATNAPMTKIAEQLKQSLQHYGSHHLMGNITGNHDIPRFASVAGGALKANEDPRKAGWQRDVGVGNKVAYKKMWLLTAFMAAIPGVPVVYYGDEIAMPGAGDPDNRRMMRFTNLSKEESELKAQVAKLFELRKNHMALLYGTCDIILATNDLLVLKRKYLDDEIIVAINNSSESRELAEAKYFKLKPLLGNSFIKGNMLELKGNSVEYFSQ